MQPKITQKYSPNFNNLKRSKNSIKFLIIHYTGMKKENDAINRLINIQSQVSSHYFIKFDGKNFLISLSTTTTKSSIEFSAISSYFSI